MSRRRKKKARKVAQAPVAGAVQARNGVPVNGQASDAQTASTGLSGAAPERLMPPKAVRPTPEQIAKVKFAFPSGPGRQEKPAINLQTDIIAQLMQEPPRLLPEQHDAARDWQGLRHEVIAELAVPGTRSCLDIGVHGHDAGDGNPALARHWRFVSASLGPERIRVLDRTCVEGAWPKDLDALRSALDAFAVLHLGGR